MHEIITSNTLSLSTSPNVIASFSKLPLNSNSKRSTYETALIFNININATAPVDEAPHKKIVYFKIFI